MTLKPTRVAVALAGLSVLSACGAAPSDKVAAPILAEYRGAAVYRLDSCPSVPVDPEPYRPVTEVAFSVASDLRSVSGHESVRFVPDRDVDEIVFRLWPNLPGHDDSVTVTSVVAGSDTEFVTESAGGRSGTQGTLVRIPLSDTAPADESLTATIDFTIDLGSKGLDAGSDGNTAWWSSAQPMLAWVHGNGWHTDPGGDIPTGYAVSEAADTTITIDTDTGVEVMATGGGDQPLFKPKTLADGRSRWTARLNRARDIGVAVGRFVSNHTAASWAPVTVAAVDTDQDLVKLADTTAEAISGMADIYGRYPFQAFKAVVLPVKSGDGVAVSEVGFVSSSDPEPGIRLAVARQWFSGLLGADQARDPWLADSLPRFAAEVAAGDDSAEPKAETESMGQPATSFADPDAYREAVTVGGVEALRAARATDPQAFDRAVVCLLNDRAWRVATDTDVGIALYRLTEAARVLARAGAWPADLTLPEVQPGRCHAPGYPPERCPE